MRKKLLTVTLSIFMALSLAACGSDNKDSDETNVIETTAEETNVEEATEETSVEEIEENPATEEEDTTEYQLTQMNSGFYGGIAWATVADDTGAKKVLINKDLQVVYELPEGMETGDIFDGKAVVIHSDQASNPGFLILGADGTVLYECSDYLTGQGNDYGYNVNFTRDGGTIYERKESGLTANTAYACILNNQFETIEQFDLSCYFENYDEIDMRRFYYYLSDGVYGGCEVYVSADATMRFILNTNEHNMVMNEEYNPLGVCEYLTDMDRCVGLLASYAVANAEGLDYSGITDGEMLRDLIAGSDRVFDSFCFKGYFYESLHGQHISLQQHIDFNHGIIGFMVQETTGIENIEGFDIPDFGAEITSFKLSNDGKYIALRLRGADGNSYYTVIGSDGQKLYEPVTADSLLSYNDNCNNLYDTWGICDGYIMSQSGNGITPDGRVFQLGDGTALSGIGENSLLYTIHRSEFCMISDGYIVCQSKLYRSDGTEVTTVIAMN